MSSVGGRNDDDRCYHQRTLPTDHSYSDLALAGVEPGDKVSFTIQEGTVRLALAAFSLQSAYGSVKALRKPEDFEKLSRLAKEDKAQRMLAELKEA